MKFAVHIARILLGLIFLVFGVNGFLHFITLPSFTGIALDFMRAMVLSHYLVVIYILEVIGGMLLLVNRVVAFALVLLGPIVANIILFHTLMATDGLIRSIVIAFLWIVVVSAHWSRFRSIFTVKADAPA